MITNNLQETHVQFFYTRPLQLTYLTKSANHTESIEFFLITGRNEVHQQKTPMRYTKKTTLKQNKQKKIDASQ